MPQITKTGEEMPGICGKQVICVFSLSCIRDSNSFVLFVTFVAEISRAKKGEPRRAQRTQRTGITKTQKGENTKMEKLGVVQVSMTSVWFKSVGGDLVERCDWKDWGRFPDFDGNSDRTAFAAVDNE
jgi:hypothetical protein